MKILIAGSLKYLDGQKLEDAQRACRELGQAIAEAGHELVIGSASSRTADFHVLSGAGERNGAEGVSPAGPPAGPVRVHIVRPHQGNDSFEKGVDRFDAFKNSPRYALRFDRGGWGWWSQRRRQVEAADGVILIGGVSGTRSVATTAFALNKPVLPIPRFGGAAEEAFERLIEVDDSLTAEERRRLSEGWDERSPKLAVDALVRLAHSSAQSRPAAVERETSLPLWLERRIRDLTPRAVKLVGVLYSGGLFVAGAAANRLLYKGFDNIF